MLWSILTTCRSNPPPPPPAPAVNHQPGGVSGGWGGGCRGWFIQGSRLPRIVPFLTVPPEHMTRFSPTNFSHFTRLSCCTHVTSEHFGKDERLFLGLSGPAASFVSTSRAHRPVRLKTRPLETCLRLLSVRFPLILESAQCFFTRNSDFIIPGGCFADN